jgi:AcrR family transcriptional regulator
MTGAGPESGYLDAARACIVAVGWRRTTLTDIARRAGVSRMTIYRRWPDMDSLLGDLLVREWSELVLDSGLTDDEGTHRDHLVRGITAMVAALRDNQLLRRIIEVDPELLQPYLFQRVGRNQAWMLQLTEEYLHGGQADGSVRAGDVRVMARALLLATYGFVLSATTLEVPPAELDAELGTILDRALRP